MITKVFTQQNMARLAVVAGAAVVVLGAGAIKSDASIKQTANGDGSITVSWDDETATDFSIGIAGEIEGKSDTFDRAKAAAASRQIVLPADAREYTFTGIDNYTSYYVCLNYSRGTDATYYTYVSNCYGKLPTVRNLSQETWYKYILSCSVTWDRLPGNCEYEVVFMDSKGKKIESKKSSSTSYSHKIDNNKIFTVKVRATRKPAYGSALPEESSGWSATEYLFCQPTVESFSINKKGELTLKWNKIKGVSSYKVYVADALKKKSIKKLGAVKANKNTITLKGYGKKGKKKFDPKKKYYVYVLPYKKVKGKTIEKGAVYYYTTKGSGGKLGRYAEDYVNDFK